jgi:hypothetical protein
MISGRPDPDGQIAALVVGWDLQSDDDDASENASEEALLCFYFGACTLLAICARRTRGTPAARGTVASCGWPERIRLGPQAPAARPESP